MKALTPSRVSVSEALGRLRKIKTPRELACFSERFRIATGLASHLGIGKSVLRIEPTQQLPRV